MSGMLNKMRKDIYSIPSLNDRIEKFLSFFKRQVNVIDSIKCTNPPSDQTTEGLYQINTKQSYNISLFNNVLLF